MAPPRLPSFATGESLFIVESSSVRVLGEDGSEAKIPLADFEAFLDFLHDQAGKPAGGPARGRQLRSSK